MSTGVSMSDIEQDEQAVRDNVKEIPPIKAMAIWKLVMGIYLLILIGIGYIAFWNQDFNNPENTVGTYVSLLADYKEKSTTKKTLNSDEFTLIVQEMMKQDADNAGDLQELASQSFNIVLGAVLAFLSASATMVFQKPEKKPPEAS